MNETFARIRERISTVFNGFTTGQRVMTGLALVAVLLGGYLFTSWASTPSYSALYTNLEPEDASAITEALASDGISYKLADNGRTIMVPSGKLYSERIALSSKGIPSGGSVGYDLLDKQGITASDFRQHVDFQRALAGELQKTIDSLDHVKKSTVNLVNPEEDLFTDDAQKSTASVLVQTEPNATLSATEVQSIVHLVSSSVEGLTPDSVTVSDTLGNLLAAPGQDGIDAAVGDARAQQTHEYEKRIADKVTDLLSAVVGPGGARVQVKAELDFDKHETTTESFENPGNVVAQTQTSDETFTGTDPGTGGTLGTDTTPAVLGTNGGTNDFSKKDATTTFAPTKTTDNVVTAPGSVKRQTVSVFLDDSVGAGVPLADIQTQVEAAAGIDAARGDTVAVSRVPFDTSTTDDAAKAAKDAAASAKWKDTLGTIRSIATLLIVGFGLLFGYRRMAGAARREEEIPLDQLALARGATEDDVLELDEEDYMELEPGAPGAQSVPVTIEEGDDVGTVLVARRTRTELDRLPGMEERMAAHADITDLIDRQPDDVAQLLRSGMSERR
jgi:flagellar M-ring protein FliF